MNKPVSNIGRSRKWKFFRAGGFDQVQLESGSDLTALEHLDRKLWVALACPVDNIHLDTRTLTFIDSDSDRRIRADELIAAIKWAAARLKNPDDLIKSVDGISSDALNDDTDEGKCLIAALRTALTALGKPTDGTLTVEEAQKVEQSLFKKAFNGDGIITEESTTEESVRALIKDIIATVGSEMDRSELPGITAEMVETFFKRAEAYAAWASEGSSDSSLVPLGDATAEAALSLEVVRLKIDDYFARCSISAFDDRAVVALGISENALVEMGPSLIAITDERCAALPLAPISPLAQLPLGAGHNPAWHDRMLSFIGKAVEPIIGKGAILSRDDWERLKKTFAPWFSWQERKPSDGVEQLGIDRITALLSENKKESLSALITLDNAEAPVLASLADVEKIARFHRDLYCLSINFVNFKDFYSAQRMAVFQTGVLYLDQRSCQLCMTIADANQHSAMAALAGAFLVYCNCRRRGDLEKMTIVAVFTNGDSDNLMVGRNGVFYDRCGNDWDASVTKIIENPISMKQAFWLPYKNLVKMIETLVAKRAAAADAESTGKLNTAAAGTLSADAVKAPPPKKIDIGTVAALGVAAGALGTFVATLLGYTTGIARLGPLAIIGALVGVLLLISGPSLILAYIKLRKRNLAPILDASGWAINAKARISVPFGATLTKCAQLPPGSKRSLSDPYAEKKSLWPKIIIILILLWVALFALDKSGLLSRWVDSKPAVKHIIEKITFHQPKIMDK